MTHCRGLYNCRYKEQLSQQNAVHDQQSSVTDGVSLSVSKSKLVYSSLMFVENKLTLICLLT